jgi:hypothetical protein
VLWFFGVDFAASLTVCLLVLPPLLLPPFNVAVAVAAVVFELIWPQNGS